ncbi:MAG: hypothetical protein KDA77_21420 [Planctomycetaceae bacterium]|nr:hypothetical protein [Planctomycetaceae bacterium]
MKKEASAATSLAAEFRLRRWARMHYVSSDQRKETWNPIVLDEMRMKDQEMREAEDNSMNARVSSMYVPLAPGVICRIDEAHEEASTPHILKMQDPATRYLRKLATELTED